jgi:hypothetical protein
MQCRDGFAFRGPSPIVFIGLSRGGATLFKFVQVRPKIYSLYQVTRLSFSDFINLKEKCRILNQNVVRNMAVLMVRIIAAVRSNQRRNLQIVAMFLYFVSPKNDRDVNRGVENSRLATPRDWYRVTCTCLTFIKCTYVFATLRCVVVNWQRVLSRMLKRNL